MGCNIDLEEEQRPSACLGKFAKLEHSFVSKVKLIEQSYTLIEPGITARQT
jgi:hypothetical protein